MPELQAVLRCGEQSAGYPGGFNRASGNSDGRASMGHRGTVRGGRLQGNMGPCGEGVHRA